MPRVLLTSDYFWPNIGGVEVLAAGLVDDLRVRGYELTVIAQADANLPDVDSYHGVRVERLPFMEAATGRDPELVLSVRKRVADLKRGFQPQVVHVYHANFNALFHLMTASAHPAPTLTTVHGEFPDSVMTTGGMLPRLLRTSAWVAACSAASLARARHQVPGITP